MWRSTKTYETAQVEKDKFVLVILNFASVFAKSEHDSFHGVSKLDMLLYYIILNSFLIETGVS